MKAVRTQFDVGEFPGTVATPTCCCSCCCCATTSMVASVVGVATAVAADRDSQQQASPLKVVLGAVAPWLIILTFVIANRFIEPGDFFLLSLVLGAVMAWGTYWFLGALLHRRWPGMKGLVVVLALLVSMVAEVYLFLGFLVFFEKVFLLEEVPSVWHLYPVFVIVVGTAVSIPLLRWRPFKGRTVVEVMAGVPASGRNDEATDNE